MVFLVYYKKGSEMYLEYGRFDEAVEMTKGILKEAQELGFFWQYVESAKFLALAYHKQGNVEAAKQYFEDSINVAIQFDNKIAIAEATEELGQILYETGDFSKAIHVYKEGAAAKESVGDRAGQLQNLHQVASIAEEDHNYRLAKEFYTHCCKLLESIEEDSSNLENQTICTEHKKMFEQRIAQLQHIQ